MAIGKTCHIFAQKKIEAIDGVALCFYHVASDGDDKWNYKELIMDDGQSWDEGIRFPAYQDVYFTNPFHLLYFDAYNYSFEDLCNINDFRVNVESDECGRRRHGLCSITNN